MSEIDTITSELEAIKLIVGTLSNLDENARVRVLSYSLDALKIDFNSVGHGNIANQQHNKELEINSNVQRSSGNSIVIDIKSLKEEKKPTSANEMAAVVAYYLQELAIPSERKTEITTEDIELYFKQAGYPLPNKVSNTLSNAQKTGYFVKASVGYKLSPVGFNLVAHKLPGANQSKTAKK